MFRCLLISIPAARFRSGTRPLTLEHARATADVEKRIEDYCAISRLINKEAIWFWTFQNVLRHLNQEAERSSKAYSGVIDVSNVWLE